MTRGLNPATGRRIHGGPSTEAGAVDGMNLRRARRVRLVHYQSTWHAQELPSRCRAGSAVGTGGPTINVGRAPAATLTGSLFSRANGAMQGNNVTQELRDLGLRDPNELIRTWEANGALGGPILRDRLWFFFSTKRQITRLYVSGMYYNKNAGDPNAWTYEPDLTRRAMYDGTWLNVPLRLTWQPATHKCTSSGRAAVPGVRGGGSPTVARRHQACTWDLDSAFHQRTWTSPLTSRLLAEAGLRHFRTKVLDVQTQRHSIRCRAIGAIPD